MWNKFLPFIIIAIILFIGCNRHTSQDKDNMAVHADTLNSATSVNPALFAFNADSAYLFTKEQVDFGPRVPGTEAHARCLKFIVDNLKRDGLTVKVQKSVARTYTGKTFDFENIIASSEPQNSNRILLCGHWDTRPFADQDSINPDKPFDGADDGASSVAALLEIGRNLNKYPADVGVDLVFFDLEDYGQQTDKGYPHMEDSWCLGSQYWAKNLPEGYNPRYGILLDMVGGKNAVFPMEGTSLYYASDIVNKIWNIAAQMGYGSYFTHDKTQPTIDDHLYVNKLANIPTIDIVDFKVKSNGEGDYPYFHHKHSDNMSVIDTATFHIVGRLLMKVIYSEKTNKGV